MKQPKRFRPQDLRTILTITFMVILVGGVYLLFYSLNLLKEYSAEVNQRQAEANAVSKQVDQLKAFKQASSSGTGITQTAAQFFATADSYQTQAINDIRAYSNAAGLTIKHIGLKSPDSQTVVVTFASPTSYTKLITFLNNIETNIPKLQVSSLSLRPADTSNADSVGVGDIEIDALVR